VQAAGPRAVPDASASLVLNTGRIRDHWHTMTRTAESGRLNRHRSEPFVELHPRDAAQHGLRAGDIAELLTDCGSALLRVREDEGQRPGSVFVPMHWSSPFASRARVDALVPVACDPHSGQPELKQATVAIRRWPVRWQALLLSEQPLRLDREDYWVALPVAGGWLYRLAGRESPTDAMQALSALLPGEPAMHYEDALSGEVRGAWMRQGCLSGVLLFTTEEGELPEPWWLAEHLGQEIDEPERRVLLSGAPAEAGAASGAIICSCFQVGEVAIEAAIADGADSTEALGEQLRCGTNCGSCVPELNRLLRRHGSANLAPTGT
jgi:assimilatory nitrate reductase catalytic subunit